ncbi:MAG: hypothetical protein IT317_24170 [Anaerolineales bacterium]|nr:hypothetical protein [Anaerolineales bacterium]
MKVQSLVSVSAALLLALAACTPGTPAPATRAPAGSTPTVAAATAVPLTNTPAPTATAAPATDTAVAPTNTAAPATETPTVEPTMMAPPDYLDDRSSAALVLASYFNAINRHEYARAYGYWDDPAAAGAFADFMAGYADTASVAFETGPQGGEGAAGTLYYTVAAVLHATQTDGAPQTFVGCYTLKQLQPANQATPPFRPMGIFTATVTSVAAGADLAPLLAAACPAPAAAVTPGPTPELSDISAAQFIDNRSTPADVLRSLFNAVNRHEYLRAYSYWKEGSSVGSFEDFEAGYASTAELTELVVGDAPPDPGAGQINYLAPVIVRATTTGGAQQTFVGCYNLHISNPGIQTDPPFVPLGIRAGALEQVANDADTTALMATACATPPLP